MWRIVPVTGLLVAGALLAGCVAPGPTPPGWREDPATGVAWRPLSAEEMAARHFEDYQRGYVFRVPGLVEELRTTEGTVRFPVRAFGGFEEARLTFDEVRETRIEGDDPRRQTTRWFEVEEPWDGAWLILPASFAMRGGGQNEWSYRVDTPWEEWHLGPDVRPDDLVTRARSPCAQWSSPGDNSSAACIGRSQPEGH